MWLPVYTALAACLFASHTIAQSNVAKYVPRSSNGISYSVNVPSSTAQSGSGSIYIQMIAPSGTRWLGLGQGNRMQGSNMFFIYSSGNNNVTLSPRLGKGEVEPKFNEAGKVTLLEGTEMSAEGVMTANIRCDSCITWEGGSANPSSSTSDWIWAVKQGSALGSDDTSADLNEHDEYGTFSFDLTTATSSDSSNPFLQAATVPNSGGSSGASGASGSGDSDGAAGGQSSDSESSTVTVRESHGIIMAIVFLFLFPLGALTVYLPFNRKVPFIHAPLQFLSACFLIAGTALGIILGTRIDEVDGYHQIIGYIVVGCLLLFQPALGLLQHKRHKKVGARTLFGHVHQWLGRILIFAGIVNGGLGLHASGEVGSDDVPTWAVIVYSVAAVIIGLFYIAFVSCFGLLRKRRTRTKETSQL